MSAPRPLFLAVLCSGLLAGTVGLAAAPAPAKPGKAPPHVAAGEELFETRVRPLLLRRCGACHSASKASGGLDLSGREPLLKGGAHGPAIVPGNPDKSLLLRAVSYADGAMKMPPSGKLADREIADLREWVRQGALWPAAAPAKSEGPLWSVQPVKKPVVPRFAANSPDGSWVRNPIDAFVLRKLRQSGMRPAPPAGRRELIRRATFDLIGLPPTPEEVDAFVADRRPDAYERLIDRLLASPHYGERWARHWLDLVRYADSNGYERDAEKPYSWKYRDYVISSLNRDKPYNRFVTEQLAGDELPDRTEESVTATGFLRLGTWDDEPNDPQDYRYERLDDLVHVTSTAFLGLTVRCARCHDHKFDPIPQKDYYAIGAAFWGGYLQPGDGRLLGGPPPEKVGFPVLGFTESGSDVPPLHLLQSGDSHREGAVVEPGFLTSVTSLRESVAPPPPGAQTTHRRLQLARWITDSRNPLTARVLVNRVWQHHFGEGIVRTPNNLGRKGSPPTHPELLDFLASVFVSGDAPAGTYGSGGVAGYGGNGQGSGFPQSLGPAAGQGTPVQGSGRGQGPEAGGQKSGAAPSHAASARETENLTPVRIGGLGGRLATDPRPLTAPWSLKALHRLIMLSSTYRMSSVHPLEAQYDRKDAGNELLWKFDRRRLDADALRDSLLAVSGDLNPEMGGRGFTPAVPRAALEGLSRKGAEWSVSPPDEQRRRSIYMFLKRALLMPFMTTFDFGDTTQPLEQRETAVVAPQALALMNNRFVSEQSGVLARRLRKDAGNDPSRQVDRLWHLAFGRSPDAVERSAALQHLARVTAIAARPTPAETTREPDSISELRLWLRADRGVTIDATGRVTGWDDQSGQKHAASQSEEKARPELVRDGLNGRPTLRFDGAGRFLRLNGQVLHSQQFTIVAVATDRAKGGSHREIFSDWLREGNIGTAIFLGTTGTASVRFSDAFAPAGTLLRPEQPHLLTAVTGPAGSAVYQNREVLAERAAGLPERRLDTPYVIGQQGNIQGEYWNGEIAEVLVYDRALTPAELTGLWSSLSRRYGIQTTPQGSPAERALESLCHAVLNSNEFVFID